MQTKNNNQTKIEGSFSSIFNSKGTMCSVAEKAKTNLEYLLKNKNNLEYRLFYFTLGNSFKNIDKESLFGKVKDETTGVVKNMRFNSISKPKGIKFYDKLEKIVNTVRNVNNHFIHDFNTLKINDIDDNEFIIFLKEAFEVAIIMSYCNEESLDLVDFFKKNRDREIVNFLHDKFFPFSDKRKDSELTKEGKERRNNFINNKKLFKTLIKEKAIDELLFIDLDSDCEWKLNEEHKVLTIEKGIYLSQYAQLFLVSMFLYKNEAEKLISKVKGFKRNDENRFKSKRRIFTFFSKKFSSQDIDAEENNLVKYQDMIQYVNHYPTAWNKALEPDSQNAEMTKVLKTKLLEFEINKNYPHYAGNIDFLEYGKLYLFGTENYRDKLHLKYLKENLSPTEIEFYEELKFDYKIRYYRDEIANPKDLENLLKYSKDNQPYTIFIISYVLKNYFPDDPRLEKFKNHTFEYNEKTGKDEDDDFYNKIATNTRTIKLIERIENNLFYTSNGRNQDRFMDFACRFLAETNFFGSDSKFKIYQFYTSDEQNKYLKENKDKPTKKEFEKKKYHQGKLVHFATYASHLKNYPNWDMPFVIENNAIQIIINGKLVSIQLNLIIYLLEHALYSTKMKGGKALFQKYLNQLEKEKTAMISTIDTINNDGSKEFKKQKATYLKLFPSRLIHTYMGIEKQEYEVINFADKIINETKKAEDIYKLLYEATKDKKQFLKKNKGKIFKLRFIKKVWNLMYFKDNYLLQKEYKKSVEIVDKIHEHEKGHHKNLHITKEEFNDFCKYIFAFGEVTDYKANLIKLLDDKSFLHGNDLEKIIITSKNIDDLYNKTKEHFTNWATNKNFDLKRKNEIKDYQFLVEPEKHIIYINLSHFIDFLLNENILTKDINNKIVYQTLKNEGVLIDSYYYKKVLPNSEYKTNNKLFNKLRSQKLEDCYLYDIANFYLKNSGKDVFYINDEKIEDKQKKKNDINFYFKEIKLGTEKLTVNDLLNVDFKFEIKKGETSLYQLIIPFSKIDNFSQIINHNHDREEDQGIFIYDMFLYLQKAWQKMGYNEQKYGLDNNKERKSNKDIWKIIHSFNTSKEITFNDLMKVRNHLFSQASLFSEIYMKMEEYFINKNKIEIKKDNRIFLYEILDLRNYFGYVRNENGIDNVETIKDKTRNKAFHLQFPLENTFLNKLKEMEKKFIDDELISIKKYDGISKAAKSVTDVLLNNLHTECFDHREKNRKIKRNKAEDNYINKVVTKK